MNDLRTPRGEKDWWTAESREERLRQGTVVPTDPRLIVFLEALRTAGDTEICSPPGLGGGWLVSHVRAGLERGILVVHHRGTHICYAPFPSNHRKVPCYCEHCKYDRECAGRTSSAIAESKARELRHEILAFQFTGPRPRIEALNADL